MGLGRPYDLHFERHRVSRLRGGVWQTAGGVVFDPETQRVLLVQIRRELGKGRHGWTWPKGRLDRGESPLVAAAREIEEETGVVPEALEKLTTFRTARALRHYFLCVPRVEHGRRTDEARDVCWVSLKRAKRLLARRRDRGVLKAARRAIAVWLDAHRVLPRAA